MSRFGESPPISHASNAVVTISSQVMIAAVIFLFMVVIFVFFLYLYAKYYMGNSDRSLRRGRGRARTRFIFAPTDQIPPTGQAQGLDTDILKSLPIKSYTPSEFKDGLECAVCLCELSEGEKLRLLPKCNHGFHVDCIDMWFHSHATCPLCRAPVTVSVTTTQVANDDALNLNFPTNVLFWGNQGQVSNRLTTQTEEGASSSSVATRAKKPEGLLVIDIPRRGMEEFVSPMVSPLPTSKFASEEVVKTPKSARLRSFTKLLSRGKTVIASSTSSSPVGAADIEQGLGVGSSTSSLALKTPTGK